MNNAAPILSFEKVSFRYEGTQKDVLHNISFELPSDSFTVIVGPSGGGKSTILSLAAELLLPSRGECRNAVRTRMVFQSGALLPWRTVEENVELGFTGLSLTEREKRVRTHEALKLLGINELSRMYPRDISGGQRQRVGIARALVSEPKLLLLDEPFSALDVETTAELRSELLRIRKEKNITMFMVSHSIEDAVFLGDRILVCAGGCIVKDIRVDLPQPRTHHARAVEGLVTEIHAAIPNFRS